MPSSARAAALGVRIVGQGETVERASGSTATGSPPRSRSGIEIEARLLAAADGGRSRLREQAGIAMHGWDYGQSGIVTTVEHERDHEGRAEEHFLPAGPFAILPLAGPALLDRVDRDGRARRSASSPSTTTASMPSSRSASA